MIRWVKAWRRKRVLVRTRLAEELWHGAVLRVPTAGRLEADGQTRLRNLATLFLNEKRFEGAAGLEITDDMRAVIAVQACVPILNLGFSAYDGWWTVIVYPDAFLTREQFTDEAGVVHDQAVPTDGEAWERGPLVLSWNDALADLEAHDGSNLIIHECAHKLDLLDGEANGVPKLHRGMDASAWQRDFRAAYDGFCRQVRRKRDTLLHPYAAECPAEFFAMASEAFFEVPDLLLEEYPTVYGHLQAYYRQDPRAAR